VITSVAFATSKREKEPDTSVSKSSISSYGSKAEFTPSSPGKEGVGSLRKEIEKWEQRAKEYQ
jgi:NAD dependent epimerase/dehydratase family enzyme